MPVMEWGVDEVAEWARTSGIDGGDAVALKLSEEGIDGNALMALEDKHDVKKSLGINLGTATKVWQAILRLKDDEGIELDTPSQHARSFGEPEPELGMMTGHGDRPFVPDPRSRLPVLADKSGKGPYMGTFDEEMPEYETSDQRSNWPGKYFKRLRSNRRRNKDVICICVPMCE